MKADMIKMIDKTGRIVIPQELQEQAGINPGEMVALDYDAETNRIVIIPLEIKPAAPRKPQS